MQRKIWMCLLFFVKEIWIWMCFYVCLYNFEMIFDSMIYFLLYIYISHGIKQKMQKKTHNMHFVYIYKFVNNAWEKLNIAVLIIIEHIL